MTDASGEGEEALAPDEQRRALRERYGAIASGDAASCCGDEAGSCGDEESATAAARLGYGADDVADAPAESNLGLGCGNPTAIAGLGEGETVLDLGSGAGFDCFLAAREVGDSGRVVGVDMTPEMVERARRNAERSDAANVEFRLGEIEHLPVADGVVDAVISNCVINLSPDKAAVFDEAFRALRPGGRLAVSDVVLTAEFPPSVRNDPEQVAACAAGAETVDAVRTLVEAAGFRDVRIRPKEESREFIREWSPERDASDYVVSATIEGRKPQRAG